jgi:DNA polymerase elongation subunit (family B)
MNFITLDIEVVPIDFEDKMVIDYLISKQFTVGLNPLFAKIIVIGLKENKQDPICYYGDNEKEILQKFWDYYYEKKPEKIVTFNGYKFDVPFIYVRSAINGLKKKPLIGINRNKWYMEGSNHFDCMLFLSGMENFQWVAKDIACKMLGISVPENRLTIDELLLNYRKGNWDPIIQYNKEDLTMTEQLYEKLLYFDMK